MGTFALASLVIGLFGTIGAIHMLRNLLPSLFRKADPEGEAAADDAAAIVVGNDDSFTPPLIGGLGMAIGVAVASYYMDPWPYSAKGLVYASLFLVLAGLWLERRGSLEERPALMVICGLAGTLVSAWFALDYLDWGRVIWSVGFALLLASALLAPFAVAMLPRAPHATPALPGVLVLIEVLLLLLFGAVSAIEQDRLALFHEFAVVALPAVGALLACLIYVARMPWRAGPAISIGIGGHMALGLLVAWGVLRLGALAAGGAGATTSLLWLVAVPVFELARGLLAFSLQRCFLDPLLGPQASRGSLARRFVEAAGYSTTSSCVFAVVMGAAGLLFWQLDVSGYWTSLGLLPAFAVYLVGSTIARPSLPPAKPVVTPLGAGQSRQS